MKVISRLQATSRQCHVYPVADISLLCCDMPAHNLAPPASVGAPSQQSPAVLLQALPATGSVAAQASAQATTQATAKALQVLQELVALPGVDLCCLGTSFANLLQQLQQAGGNPTRVGALPCRVDPLPVVESRQLPDLHSDRLWMLLCWKTASERPQLQQMSDSLMHTFCMQVVPLSGLACTLLSCPAQEALLCCGSVRAAHRSSSVLHVKCSLQLCQHLPLRFMLSASCLQFQATASALTAAIFSLNPKFSQLAVCFVTRLATLDFGCSILTNVFGGQQAVFLECLPCISCMQETGLYSACLQQLPLESLLRCLPACSMSGS